MFREERFLRVAVFDVFVVERQDGVDDVFLSLVRYEHEDVVFTVLFLYGDERYPECVKQVVRLGDSYFTGRRPEQELFRREVYVLLDEIYYGFNPS